MKKFIFGLTVLILGFIFNMLCLFYTIMNPVVSDGESGLFISFREDYTLIPFIASLIIILIGVMISYDTFKEKKNTDKNTTS